MRQRTKFITNLRLRMQRSIAFGRVCLSVCPSAML